MIQVSGPNPTLCNVVTQTLQEEGVDSGRVDMVFVNAREMTSLNVEHMGGDGPTDVLAFPIDGLDAPPDPGSPRSERHIGDIVICTDVARAQSAQHMGDEESELVLLSIHATLHLCGYDHHTADERAHMWSREAGHLKRYGLEHPGDQR